MIPERGAIYQPELDKSSADLVIVGGGPAGVHLVNEMQAQVGSEFRIVLLEQDDILGGSGHASMQQLRTLQGNEHMIEMIVRTRGWYKAIGAETERELITPIPYLFVAADDNQLVKFADDLNRVQRWGYGGDGCILSAEELHKRFPFIDGEVAGALLYPEAAEVDFGVAIDYITKGAPNATFALGTKMCEVRIEEGKVVGVVTDRGFISTDKVVLATGPFAIKASDQIVGVDLGIDGGLSDLIVVKKRQRFSALVSGLPSKTRVFVIGTGGQYVRLHTNENGEGSGDYGFANPDDLPIFEPVLKPRADELEFPAIVYSGLGRIISGYGDEEHSGPLAKRPTPGSRIAGYYADTKDDLPIVCQVKEVPGLYLSVGHSHAGVMDAGAASHMAGIILNGEPEDNPFSIKRQFKGEGIRL